MRLTYRVKMGDAVWIDYISYRLSDHTPPQHLVRISCDQIVVTFPYNGAYGSFRRMYTQKDFSFIAYATRIDEDELKKIVTEKKPSWWPIPRADL